MTQRTLLLPALVLLAGAALAGCTNTDDAPNSRSTQRPTNTETATAPPVELEKATIECKDGQAKITDQNNKELTVPSCDTVIVSTSNAVIKTGTIKHLEITGAINNITADKVDDVTITGDGNHITTSSTPELHDSGNKNVLHDTTH